ncbi:MAG: hypothetical protein WD004_04725 [Actinomycetota bacterium]
MGDVAWMIESSRDGEKWRSMGKAWTHPNERLLVHGASTYLRFRSADGPVDEWVGPLERDGDCCMALLDLDTGTRTEVWPADEHFGLPVFLPGGEAGRLLRFEVNDEGTSWSYALEFQGERHR